MNRTPKHDTLFGLSKKQEEEEVGLILRDSCVTLNSLSLSVDFLQGFLILSAVSGKYSRVGHYVLLTASCQERQHEALEFFEVII